MFNESQFTIAYNKVTNIKENHLKLLDIYVYALLKLYMNRHTNTATITLKTLEEKSTLTAKTLQISLANLKQAKFIEFTTVRNVTTSYKFTILDDGFEKIPQVLLLTKKLEPKEKGYMICVQKYLFDKNVFKEGNLKNNYTYYTPRQLANLLAISENTAIAYTEALKRKGFIYEMYTLNTQEKANKTWIFNYPFLYEETNELLAENNDKLEQITLKQEENHKILKMKDEQIENLLLIIDQLKKGMEDLEEKNQPYAKLVQSMIKEMQKKDKILKDLNEKSKQQ